MQVTRYLGYSSLKDFFPTMDIKPNPGCSSKLCRSRQSNYMKNYNSLESVAARKAAQEKAEQEIQPASHTENEWKIEIVPEEKTESSSADPSSQAPHRTQVAEGLQYEMPVRTTHLYTGV